MPAWPLPTPVDHRRTLERDHLNALLVVPGRPDCDNANVQARFRIADLEHLGARVDRIPLEHGIWEANLIPAEVGHDVLGDVGDALACHQGERQAAVDQRLAELSLRGILVVEVDWSRVLSQ